MDRLVQFAAFVRACETGSFSAVAREFRISQPTVSKQIAALEAWFGFQLFSRTTRRLSPTADAQRIYPLVRQMQDVLELIEADGRDKHQVVSGTLRMVLPESFGRAEIVPRLGRYMREHPRVRIELRMTDDLVDLVEVGAELGIRIGKLAPSALIARRIATVRHIVVAARDYLRGRGEPLVPDELAQHQCIVYSGFSQPTRWLFDSEFGRQAVEITPILALDSADAMADAVRAGLGVAVLPSWLLVEELRSGRVRQLLADFYPPAQPVQVIYPETRWLSQRARSFIDFIVGEFGESGATPT